MQKLETRNGTLLFVKVPESIEPYTKGLFIHSLEWLDKGGTLQNYPFSNLDKCKEYEILGEVTKGTATFDFNDYLPEKVNGCYVHPTTGFALMQSQGIELTEGSKFVVNSSVWGSVRAEVIY